MVKAKPFFNRITAILLALLMLIPTMTVFEASGTSLSVGTAVGKPGDQVSVNIALSGNSGIAYLKLKIGYDATQLTLKGAQNAGVLTGTFTTSKTPDINPYVLQWMGAENSSGNGVVATLSFQIASTASAGDKAISVSVVECYNENYDDVTLSASNGKITVNTTSPKVLSSISVSKQPTKTTYFVGESLDTAGLQLKLTYDDGSTSYVTSGFTTSGFSSTSAGTKTVMVTYSGKTTTFTVSVQTKPITAIISANNVSANPGDQVSVNIFLSGNPGIAYLKLKIGYDATQLTLKGAQNAGVLTGTFTTSKTLDVNPYVIQWMGAENSSGNGVVATLSFQIVSTASAGDKAISVGVEECYNEDFDGVTLSAANGKVMVNTTSPKVLTSISVSNQPTKTTYFVGESLDTTGLQLKLTYSDGSTSYATNGFTTSGFNSTSAGTKTVTVTFNGKTTTFIVTVKQNNNILMGDIDGDGEITTDDAMMVISYLNGKTELTISQRLSADVMHDLQLNSVDALAITKYANNGQINGLVGQTILLGEFFGDANNDGIININDATYMQKYLAEYQEFSELQHIIADVNGDGNVTIQDVTELQRYLAELINYFPVLDSI